MSTFEREEINGLYKPFTLNEHEIREGSTSKTGKVQWFVYVRRAAIQQRLDEIFCGEWELNQVELHRGNKYVSAIMRLTIRGKSREFNGGSGGDGGLTEDVEKGALTDAFKRVASMWGLGLYLQDTPQIWTDGYKDANDKKDWNKWRQREKEAFEQFVKWYQQSIQPTPSNVTPIPTDAAKAALGTPSGQRVETDDVLPTTPNLQPANVVKVSIKPTGEGNRKELILTMEDSKIGFVRAYSRKLFIDAGWIDDSQWMANEVIDLTPPIPVLLKRDAKTGRYWELADVVKPENPFIQDKAG